MSSVPQRQFGIGAPEKHLRRTFAAALASLAVLFCSSAYGDDYHVPLSDVLRGSQAPSFAPASYPRWDGFYFGGQIGRSFGSVDFSNANGSQIGYILANTELENLVSDWTTLPNGSSGSNAYGGFVGYNIQWDDVITGIEVNYNHVALSNSASDTVGPISVNGANLANGSTVSYAVTVASSASVSISDILTGRARFGWAFDRFLPYGFVGFAVGRADVTNFTSVTGTKTVTPPTNPITGNPGVPSTGALILPRNPQSSSASVVAWGYTAGLGVDIGITDNVFLRGEWEYDQFPNVNGLDINVNSVHAGLGFKF